MCLLSVSTRSTIIQPPEIGQNRLKCPKIVIFQNMGIYEIVNPPFESGGGGRLGPFRVSQILPCFFCASSSVCTDGLRGMMGWWDMAAPAHYHRLVYARRFEWSNECWGKQVWNTVKNNYPYNKTWRKGITDLCNRYDIMLGTPVTSLSAWGEIR